MSIVPTPSHNMWGKWHKVSSLYGFIRYTHHTKNARVKYVNSKYRELFITERLLVIGIGTYISPVVAPLIVARDLTKIECKLKNIDPSEVGLDMNNERDNWMYFI